MAPIWNDHKILWNHRTKLKMSLFSSLTVQTHQVGGKETTQTFYGGSDTTI